MIPFPKFQTLAPLFKNRRRLVVIAAAGLLLIGSGAAFRILHHRIRVEELAKQKDPRHGFEECMKMEEYWARQQNKEQMIRWLRYAIDVASAPEDRAVAGLKRISYPGPCVYRGERAHDAAVSQHGLQLAVFLSPRGFPDSDGRLQHAVLA